MAEKVKVQRGERRWARKANNQKLMAYLETERQKRGLLRSQFAERAHIGGTTYSNWCNIATRVPDTASLHQLADAYGFDIKHMTDLLDIETEERGG